MSRMFLPPAPCLLKHSAWFPLRSQLSAGSANSEHDTACYTRAWMPLGAWQELLTWHRKALAGLSLEPCHKPQVNPDPSCPPSILLDSAVLRAAPGILHPADEPPSKQVLSNEVYPRCFLLHSHHTKHSKKNIKYSWFSY